MTNDGQLPLWLRPSDFLKSATGELNDFPDGSVSAFMHLDSQHNLHYGMLPKIDHGMRVAFADDYMWQKQRVYYQDACREFFKENEHNPAWFAVIRNRVGFTHRFDPTGQQTYVNPAEAIGPPQFQSLAKSESRRGLHFGFIHGEKLPAKYLSIITRPRCRRLTIPTSGRTHSSTGSETFATLPDSVVDGELSIPALQSVTDLNAPHLMKTTSLILAKLLLVKTGAAMATYVVQRIFTLWASTGHTASHADDGPRTLEMYLHLYCEEYRLLRKIIDGTEYPDIIADGSIV